MPPTEPLDLFTVRRLIDSVRDVGEPHHIMVDPATYRRLEPLTSLDTPFILLGLPIIVSAECPPHTLYVMQEPAEETDDA
jgi:hypothetical protein